MLFTPPTSAPSTTLPTPTEIDAVLLNITLDLIRKHPGANFDVVQQRIARRAMRIAGVPAVTIAKAIAQAAYRNRHGKQITVRPSSNADQIDRVVELVGLDAVWARGRSRHGAHRLINHGGGALGRRRFRIGALPMITKITKTEEMVS
jgi:hypothetical protein